MASSNSTGTIRASLLAVPRRLPMLAAKGVVFALLVLIVGELAAFGSFFAGSAMLHGHAPMALGDPGVTRAVLGAGLYLAVLGLFAMAIGALLRHTAAGISTAIGVVFVLPIIAGLLPGCWGAKPRTSGNGGSTGCRSTWNVFSSMASMEKLPRQPIRSTTPCSPSTARAWPNVSSETK